MNQSMDWNLQALKAKKDFNDIKGTDKNGWMAPGEAAGADADWMGEKNSFTGQNAFYQVVGGRERKREGTNPMHACTVHSWKSGCTSKVHAGTRTPMYHPTVPMGDPRFTPRCLVQPPSRYPTAPGETARAKKKKNMDRNREPPPRPLRAIEGLVQVLCRRLQ